MSDKTGIEWTRGDDGTAGATWNPVTGCEKISPGCDHCYASTFAERWRGTPGHYFERGFDVQLRPDKLDQPLRWKRPRRVFVNSMSDLFHKDVPDEYIACVFTVMARASQHTFQVLTKRHARMRSLLPSPEFQVMCFAAATARGWDLEGTPWPLPNVWLGVSTEDQHWADIRIPALLETPAAVRFISAEPLLGPIDLHGPVVNGHRPRLTYWLDGRPGWGPEHREPTGLITQELTVGPSLDWVIAGGESGPGARPMHPAWARSLRDQCAESGVPFFFKQWGEYAPWAPEDFSEPKGATVVYPDGSTGWVAGNEDHLTNWTRGLPDGWAFATRVGKKRAGRELDGREWSEFPRAAEVATA
jgi:protein gp37